MFSFLAPLMCNTQGKAASAYHAALSFLELRDLNRSMKVLKNQTMNCHDAQDKSSIQSPEKQEKDETRS